MTTIVGYAKGPHTILAADSCTNVYERPIHSATKIIRHPTASRDGVILLGFSGAGAARALVAQHLTVECLPNMDDPADRHDWATSVAVAITGIYLDHGLQDGGDMDGHVLLAAQGHLWTIAHNVALSHPDGIAAIGSGEGPAIGALHALTDAGIHPVDACVRAVHYAARLDLHTGGRTRILTA